MTSLILILALGLLTIGSFMVGAAVARKNTMPRRERQELEARRQYMDNLQQLASEHVALGDPFAAIVLDEYRTFRNQITWRKNR